MKLVTVIGARPQFIKAAAVSKRLADCAGADEILVHTGQHFDDDMSAVFFQELGLPRPHYQLGIGGGPHGRMTGRMLEAIEAVLLKEVPDRVLIYGDTNSTLAGALAAAKLHIPVAHVEAGLRSFNRKMPEELNRVTADHLSDQLFAPTGTAVENLRKEGITGDRVHLVGDVMYDAALMFGADDAGPLLERCRVPAGQFVLATIHRAENSDDPVRLRSIISALVQLAEEVPVLFPLHPRTKGALDRDHLSTGSITMLRPLGYLDMVRLEKNARLIVTDSGGVQKEAFFHRVRCVTLRDETEWVELLTDDWNRLVPPTDASTIVDRIRDTLRLPAIGNTPTDLYGGGRAAIRVAELLTK